MVIALFILATVANTGSLPGLTTVTLGSYQLTSDTVTVHKERAEAFGVDPAFIRFHERVHRWQFQRVPLAQHVLPVTMLAVLVSLLCGIVFMRRWGFTYAALFYLVGIGGIELHAYVATWWATGWFGTGVIPYVLMPIWVFWAGDWLEQQGDWVLYGSDRSEA
jgi:hypothetical protein